METSEPTVLISLSASKWIRDPPSDAPLTGGFNLTEVVVQLLRPDGEFRLQGVASLTFIQPLRDDFGRPSEVLKHDHVECLVIEWHGVTVDDLESLGLQFLLTTADFPLPEEANPLCCIQRFTRLFFVEALIFNGNIDLARRRFNIGELKSLGERHERGCGHLFVTSKKTPVVTEVIQKTPCVPTPLLKVR